jgi:predicted Na+-dependent transporter
VLVLRVVAAMPVSLKANWVMQMTQVRRERAYRRAVRVSWLMLAVAPVEMVVGAVFLWAYPRGVAWLHLALLLALGWLMVELCLTTFAKAPFACSYLPGKANLHVVFWVLLFGMIPLLRKALEFESRLLLRPWWFCGLVVCVALPAAGVAAMTEMRSRSGDVLVFEEEYGEQIVTLNLR